MLELEVPVYNINNGRNPEIMKKTRSLHEYATFIASVRAQLGAGKSLGEAIECAINECITRGIMAEFLNTHKVEVRSLLFSEVSVEDIIRVRTQEARDEARDEGYREAEDKWKGIVADVVADVVADKDAIIAKLRAQLGQSKLLET